MIKNIVNIAPYKQGVTGSNPVVPTLTVNRLQQLKSCGLFLFTNILTNICVFKPP